MAFDPPMPAAPGQIALFVDIDGTLLELADRPDTVVVPAGLAGLLHRLYDRLDGALALVTGRPLVDVAWLFPEFKGDAAGLHGAEWRCGGAKAAIHQDPKPLLAIAKRFEALAIAHPGLLVEHKGPSVALHYRHVPKAAVLVEAAMTAAMVELGPGWQLIAGKAVFEILPAAASKGQAIDRFLDHQPYAGRKPAFLGDDVTDESGFAAVLNHGGLAIKVGPGDSRAPYRLPSVTAVHHWLRQLAGGGKA
ncbi:MAG: trehalose-phosphatase [Ferrovibrionaceae bacterium]